VSVRRSRARGPIGRDQEQVWRASSSASLRLVVRQNLIRLAQAYPRTVHRSEPRHLVGGRRSSDRHSRRWPCQVRPESRSERVSGAAELAMPSFRSSPWMRGAPHRGFAAAIVRTRLAISVLTQGRPPVGRRESWVQYSRKRRRCHRRTVSGDTMTSACLQPAQTRARPAQNRRSVVRSLGRARTLGPGPGPAVSIPFCTGR
jgi:hypothetical protein